MSEYRRRILNIRDDDNLLDAEIMPGGELINGITYEIIDKNILWIHGVQESETRPSTSASVVFKGHTSWANIYVDIPLHCIFSYEILENNTGLSMDKSCSVAYITDSNISATYQRINNYTHEVQANSRLRFQRFVLQCNEFVYPSNLDVNIKIRLSITEV